MNPYNDGAGPENKDFKPVEERKSTGGYNMDPRDICEERREDYEWWDQRDRYVEE